VPLFGESNNRAERYWDAALSIIKELRPFRFPDMFRRIHSDCAAVVFAAKFSALQTCSRLLSLGNND
jgi:hypothetical protein